MVIRGRDRVCALVDGVRSVAVCVREGVRGAAPNVGSVTDRGVASATGSQISIAAGSAAFTPTCVTDVPQGTVTLVVHNVGQVIHDVQVVTQHIHVGIAPGATVRVRAAMGRQTGHVRV